LHKFHLAVEVARETKFTDEDDFYTTPTEGSVYLVPSMLIYNEAKIYKPKPGDIVLLFCFPDDKFIPEDVFNQIRVKMVAWSNQHGHHIQRYVHYILQVKPFVAFTMELDLSDLKAMCSVLLFNNVHKPFLLRSTYQLTKASFPKMRYQKLYLHAYSYVITYKNALKKFV